MSKPIKEYSLGKCKAAIFQGDYQGKPTYSVKFQKSYTDKQGAWKNTDYFNLTDLRELAAVVNFILAKQIKERVPGAPSSTQYEQAAPKQYTPQQVQQELSNMPNPIDDSEVPF